MIKPEPRMRYMAGFWLVYFDQGFRQIFRDYKLIIYHLTLKIRPDR